MSNPSIHYPSRCPHCGKSFDVNLSLDAIAPSDLIGKITIQETWTAEDMTLDVGSEEDDYRGADHD